MRSWRYNQWVAWLVTIAWMGLIWALSNQPGLQSGLVFSVDFVLRKGAHLAEYAVLVCLFAWAFGASGYNRQQRWVLAIGCSLAYAGLDEWHQTFVAGREGRPRDVAIDGVGILITALVGRRKL